MPIHTRSSACQTRRPPAETNSSPPLSSTPVLPQSGKPCATISPLHSRWQTQSSNATLELPPASTRSGSPVHPQIPPRLQSHLHARPHGSTSDTPYPTKSKHPAPQHRALPCRAVPAQSPPDTPLAPPHAPGCDSQSPPQNTHRETAISVHPPVQKLPRAQGPNRIALL